MPDTIKALEEGLKTIFPIESSNRQLVLKDLKVDTNRSDAGDLGTLKKLKLQEGTWGHPVYADLELTDKNTGKTIDTTRVRVGTLPQQTPHKTYMVKGTEYQFSNVQRLNPGVYARQKSNDTYEAKINPRNARDFKMILDPSRQKYQLNVGSATVYLYPLLKELGVSDTEIKKRWGEDLFNANADTPVTGEEAVRKFYEKTIGRHVPEDYAAVKDAVRNYLSNGKLDPFATSLTLGKAHETLSPGLLLDASEKLLKVHQGKASPDRPHDIYFQSFHNEETILRERLQGIAGRIGSGARKKMDSAGKIRDFFYPNKIREAIEQTFTTTQNAVPSETTNPLDIISSDTVVTLKGPGGINSVHAIRPEDRDLHPSSLGILDPVKTPQGNAGISVHTALSTTLENNELKVMVYDLKARQQRKMTSSEYANKVVAFPNEFKKNQYGQYEPVKARVMAIKGDQIVEVSPKEVDAIIPDPKLMFNQVTNLIPFLNADSGPRAMFGANQMTQAVPLKYRENRMVQTKIDDTHTFDEEIAKQFLPQSPVDGTVEKVEAEKIVIKSGTGDRVTVPIYKNFPLNQDSFLDNKPLVKPGDSVKQDQILADNNFTRNGNLALGQNLVFALMPWKGFTYEDGVVVSETGARKLTSEHLRGKNRLLGDEERLDSRLFRAYSPTALSLTNSDKLDEQGLIKPGTRVEPGDILATVVRKPRISKTDVALGRLGVKTKEWKPDPITWDMDHPGIVTDAVRTGDKLKIFVRTEEPAKVGDKVSIAHGGKGVITHIIPDAEAPFRKSDGKTIDIIVDPHGIPSRMNVGQLYELAAGKISEKTGQPFKVENFTPGADYRKILKEELEKFGLPDKEPIVDPATGKEIPDINVGRQHVFKLKHQIDKKMGVRSFDQGYTRDEQPVSGKRLDRLSFYALVAHGAKENLREMATRKATMDHDDYWAMVRNGDNFFLPEKPTFAYKKFDAMLNSLGVKTDRAGDTLQMMPLTDAEIRKMAPRKILRPDAMIKKNLIPRAGGLFDNDITGGMDGRFPRFSRIELPEPFPNPLFEKPIKHLLGLKKIEDIDKIVAGQQLLNEKTAEFCKIAENEPTTGPLAIYEALKNIDVDEELRKTEAELRRSNNKGKRSEYNARIRYLRNLKSLGLNPADAYTLKNIPVIPPNMRPIYQSGTGNVASDINQHYRNLLLTNNSYTSASQTGLQDTKNEALAGIYTATKQLMGLGGGNNYRQYKGILDEIAPQDEPPKYGYFQRKVMYSPQEQSARTIITADPTLGVDEVGYPEEIAWEQYEPFVHRRMRKMYGMNHSEIRKAIQDRTPSARKALEAELKERPVIVNRAPSWHRFNVMAMQPRLVPGKELRVPNLPINKYFGGDFDGDAMSIHVPISESAVAEAKELFPSKYLFKPGTRSGDDVKLMLAPEQSALIGLNYLSRDGKVTNLKFGTAAEAKAAERSSKIRPDDQIEVNGKRTTVGKLILGDILPADKPFQGEITHKTLRPYLVGLAETHSDIYPRLVNDLNQIGEQYATEKGFSLGLADLEDIDDQIKPLIEAAEQDTKRKKDDPAYHLERMVQLVKDTEKKIPEIIDPGKNSFGMMMQISGKGNPNQIRQILGAGLLYENARGGIVPVAVKEPYAKGLTPADFFIQQIGARKGLIDRSVETSKPGEIGKQLLASNADRVITTQDCGTSNGITVNLDATPDYAYDHIAAEGNSYIGKGEPVSTAAVAQMLKNDIKTLKVRSPLRCEAANGLCAKCYGLNERGKLPDIGENVGVQETQAVVERSANFTLKSWHTSGVKEKQADPFDRYQELVQVPKTISNQAIVSTITGTISGIQKNPVSGYDVEIDGKRHTVPGNVKTLLDAETAGRYGVDPLKVGSKIQKGDRLSTGNLRPQDILDFKGIEPTQDYMTDELHGLMKDLGIKRKTVETVISGITNLAHVEDPGDSDFAPYDFAQTGVLRDFNKNLEDTVPVEQSLGKRLAEAAGGYGAGTEITKDVILRLKAKKVHQVKVEKRPVRYNPILRAAAFYPLRKQEDWLANLDFTHLRETIREGAARGYKSDIHGLNPVSAFAYGAEFGKPGRDKQKPGGY